MLDGVGLAVAHRHREAVRLGDVAIAAVCAGVPGALQHHLREAAQFAGVAAETVALRHGGAMITARAGRNRQQDPQEARDARAAGARRGAGRAPRNTIEINGARRRSAGSRAGGEAHQEPRGQAPADAVHRSLDARHRSGRDPQPSRRDRRQLRAGQRGSPPPRNFARAPAERRRGAHRLRCGASGRRPSDVAQLDQEFAQAAAGGQPHAGLPRAVQRSQMKEQLIVGLVSISDRASAGVYRDEGIPSLKEWLHSAIASPAWRDETRLIADEMAIIESTLVELVDEKRCHLVLTTGGTGPARRDVTPEATLAIADKVMPGFGEQMRSLSLKFVPTAILSRQVAVIRKQALIINLPGQPKSIRETLQGLPDAPGIFAAVPYCIDLIGGPYIETNEAVVKAFRPKSAIKKK